MAIHKFVTERGYHQEVFGPTTDNQTTKDLDNYTNCCSGNVLLRPKGSMDWDVIGK